MDGSIINQSEVRCNRCRALDCGPIAHGYCLDCVQSVYLLAGNWCAEHGPFPLQWSAVGEIRGTGVPLEAPLPRDEQSCPWCCHGYHTSLAWGDYCVQCAADGVAAGVWMVRS